MNTYYLILLTVFGVVGYMMIMDENVTVFLTLIPRIIKLNVERFYWKIRFHPAVTTNKLSQWMMMRKYEKLIKEYEQQNKTDSGSDAS